MKKLILMSIICFWILYNCSSSHPTNDDIDEDTVGEDVKGNDTDGGINNLLEPYDCISDSDCGEDGKCIRVPDQPGGYWTCKAKVEEATMSVSPNDECTTSADCANLGENCGCYTVEECYDQCMLYNKCICDECEKDSDCSEDEICVPGGVWGFYRNTCVKVSCKTSYDCTEGSEPQCLPFFDPCIGTLLGKYCTYRESECRRDEDCINSSNGIACVINGDRPECVDVFPCF